MTGCTHKRILFLKGNHSLPTREGEGWVFLFAMLLICLHVHEVVELGGVGELNLDDPVAESVLVEELGLVLEGFVDLNDGTADRSNQVAGGLHTLHGAELFACGDFIVHLGHIDIHDITQRVLSIVRNTNVTKFAFYANVLV